MDQTVLSTNNVTLTNIVDESKESFVPLTTVPSANAQLHQFTTMENRMYAFLCSTILSFI